MVATSATHHAHGHANVHAHHTISAGGEGKKETPQDVKNKVVELEYLLKAGPASTAKQESQFALASVPAPSGKSVPAQAGSAVESLTADVDVGDYDPQFKDKVDVGWFEDDNDSDDSGGASRHISDILRSISEQLEHPTTAKVPVLSLEKGMGLLAKENTELDAEERRKRAASALRKPKPHGVGSFVSQMSPFGKKFVQPTPFLQMIKTSMRFVPGVNNAPNVYGELDDPPYLFKTPGRELKARVSGPMVVSDTERVGEDEQHHPEHERPKVSPAFALAWPAETNQGITKPHQNMLAAFMNYYTRKAQAEASGRTDTELPYDPNLSINCALACGRAPFPKFLEDGLRRAIEAGAPIVPVPRGTAFGKTGELEFGGAEGRKSREGEPGRTHDDFVPPEFIPIEEIGPVYPFPPSSHYELTTVPVFPDLENDGPVGIPPGAKAGYMDQDGIFHKANSGDILPSNGATIGYMDNDGTYHEVMGIEDGVNNGQLASREGYKIIRDHAHPEEAGHDGEGVGGAAGAGAHGPGADAMGGKQGHGRHGASHAGATDKAGAGGHDGKLGDSGSAAGLVHMSSVSMSVRPKESPTLDQLEANLGGRYGAEGPGAGSKSGRDGRQDGGLTGQDLKQAAPDGGAGGAVGYMGKDGEFVEVKPNEVIPANAKPAYKDPKTGKLQELHPPPKSMAGAGGLLTGQDLKQAAPDGGAGGAVGYMGKDGEFVEVKPNEVIPANAKPAYKDPKTGKLQELHLPPKSMAGAGGPLTGQDLKQAAPDGGAGGAVGYMGKDGEFVEVKPNEVIPANAKPAYKDPKTGKLQELHPPPKSMAGAGGQLTGQDLKNAAPGNGAVGYIDKDGKFVELGSSDLLPPGAKAMYKDPKTGKLHELHPPPKSMAGAGGQLTGQDLKNVAPGNGAVGYIDKDGKFVELGPSDLLPPGAKAMYKDPKTGKLHELHPPPKSMAGAGGPLTGHDLKQAAPDGGAGGAVGYMGKDGEFVEVKPNEVIPANAKAVYKDPKTGKLQELHPPPKSMAAAGGLLTGQDLKQAAPDGGAGGAVGYMGKDGEFVEVKSKETIPANAKPVYKDLKSGKTQELHPPPKSTTGADGPLTGHDLKQAAPDGSAGGAVGYIGKNGQFVELGSQETIPANTKPAYKDLKSGKTQELHPPPIAGAGGPLTGQDLKQAAPDGGAGGAVGYMGKDGEFVEVKSKETIPANAKPVYKDLKSGKTQELHPPPKPTAGADGPLTGHDLKQAAPDGSAGGAVGYIGKNGQFVELGSQETIPANTKPAYKDLKSGKTQELHPPPKSMAGAGGPLTGQDLKQAVPDGGAGGAVGYMGKDGEFVEVKSKEVIPANAKLVYKDLETGKTVDLIPPTKGGAGGLLTGHDLKQVAPDGGAGVAVGYVGRNGQFVELTSQETIPANAKPVYKDLKTGKFQELTLQPMLPEGSEMELRESPLTEEELKRLKEFQRHIAVQVELEFVEGSLDLGEVVRNSFRIYSNGASIDIRKSMAFRDRTLNQEGENGEEEDGAGGTPAKQKTPTIYPEPKK